MQSEECRWLFDLGFFDADAAPLESDLKDWLHEVFVERGPLGWDEINVMSKLAMFEVAYVACERVARDFQKSEARSISVSIVDDGGVARVKVDGRLANGVGVRSVGVEQLTVEVAEAVQEEVMEDMWRPWPECSRHRLGLHPQIIDGTAVWWCRTRSHVQNRIGNLGLSNRS